MSTFKIIVIILFALIAIAVVGGFWAAIHSSRKGNNENQERKARKLKFFLFLAAALMAVQTAWAVDGWSVQEETNGNVTTFTISRTDKAKVDSVKYRLVNLSAYAGEHYKVTQVNGEDKTTAEQQTAALSGELAFGVNEGSKTIRVRETTATTNAYKYQTGAQRSYKMEVTDRGGFLLADDTRSFSVGTQVTGSGVFDTKNVTIQTAEYTADDRGYDSNGYKSVSASSYCTSGTQAYLGFLNAQLRMTLSFDAKENDDAYSYLQILVDNTSTCDGRGNANDGDPGTPSLSRYMAAFEMNTGSKDPDYKSYTFPVTSVGSDAGATNPWGYGTAYPLTNQKFKSGSRATDGKLIVPTNFNSLVLRLNASGKKGSDEWAVKNVKAHIQAIDATAPTMLTATADPGMHAKGNTVYVSVAFSEIVQVTGTPTLTTDNGWGTLTYVAGSGSNVLTFKGEIPGSASNQLIISGLTGTVKDLAGNSLSGGVSTLGLCWLNSSWYYTISYDPNGGTMPASYSTKYAWYSSEITLKNPTRLGYWFDGWTGSNGNTPQTTVTIEEGSHGDKHYIANWTQVWTGNGTEADPFTITNTKGLDLLAQYVNSGNDCDTLYFQLGADITYPYSNAWNVESDENNYTAIGTRSNPFKGTFDGQNHTISGIRIYKGGSYDADRYHGLFGKVLNGTVKRVRIADTRITAFYNIAGITGYAEDATIEDCIVDSNVCMHTMVTGAECHGGIAGYNKNGTVHRCISRVTLTKVNDLSTGHNYGGIVGGNNGTITDCLALGVTIPDVKGGRGAIVGSVYSDGILARNYYRDCKVASNDVTPSGIGKGDGWSLSTTSDVDGARPLYSLTIIGTNVTKEERIGTNLPGTNNKTYENGATIAGDEYYISEASVALVYSAVVNTGYYLSFSTTAGTLIGEGTSYTFTMPAQDATVTVTCDDVWGVESGCNGNAEHPYTITSTQGLNLLAAQVYGSNTTNNFQNQYFRLGADITYPHGNSDTENNYTPIGCINNGAYKYFNGTFDGQGHTISGIRIYKGGTTNYDDNQGLFGLTDGATIKNVILADARITGREEVGGIVGLLLGAVENCRVGSDVTIHAVAECANDHGGVAGGCNGTISGCVSAATLTVANGLTYINNYGGIVGYFGGNMSDCFAIGATVPAADNIGAVAGYVYSGTQTNCYYRDCTVGAATHQTDAYTVSAGTDVTLAPAGDPDRTYLYNGIKRYGSSLYYGDVLYAPADADVSLSLNYTVSSGLIPLYTPTAGTITVAGNPYTLTMPAQNVIVNAVPGVAYIDADGTPKGKAASEVTFLESGTTTYGTNDATNWYVVSGEVTINGQLKFKDSHSHLIVCDGATLTVNESTNNAIYSGYGRNIIIYGQSAQTGTISATSEGAHSVEVGDLTINGGNVNVTATDNNSHGILSMGNIIINRGTVTATCSNGSAINSYQNVTINGGTVTATGVIGINSSNNVTINGGSITAHGSTYNAIYGYYGVTINGGIVDAESPSKTIYADAGTLTLGWTNPTDSIKASSYGTNNGTILVKDGQALTDGTDFYTDTLTSEQIGAIAGKTLRPAIPYIDADGTTKYKAISDVTVITSSTTTYGSYEATNWYVVSGNVTMNKLYFNDQNAHIILCDGATLTIHEQESNAIYCPYFNITIYGQSLSTGTINATSDGASAVYVNDLTVNGGNFNVTATYYGCEAIRSLGNIIINRGTVTASSNDGSAIYGHNSLTINGGIVTVTDGYFGIDGGNNVTINGGRITASGGYAIYGYYGVTINGGNITATGSNDGIYVNEGDIILGWTNLEDSITASNYRTNSGSILVKDGQTLTDDTYTYTGTLNYDQLYAIANQTLRPYTVVIPTAIDEANDQSCNRQSSNRKFIKDGQVLILRDGKVYNMQGALLK